MIMMNKKLNDQLLLQKTIFFVIFYKFAFFIIRSRLYPIILYEKNNYKEKF